MENFSLTYLSLVNSKKDILLDIPRDMFPFSVFGSGLLALLKGQVTFWDLCLIVCLGLIIPKFTFFLLRI